MRSGPIRWLVGTLTLAVLGSGLAYAGDSGSNVHELTGPPVHFISALGKDYRLGTVHAHNARGLPIADLPATSISVFDGLGDWEHVDSSALPPFTLKIPEELRKQVQLFYSSASDWLIVPRDWHVQRAAVGADGSAEFSFVAASGISGGWMSWENTPACWGCIMGAADGLFPGAHKNVEKLLGKTVPEPVLEPKPDMFERLDACTVRLAYRMPHSPPIQSIEFFWRKGDPSFSELAVALPKSQFELTTYLLATFHKQSSDPACRVH